MESKISLSFEFSIFFVQLISNYLSKLVPLEIQLYARPGISGPMHYRVNYCPNASMLPIHSCSLVECSAHSQTKYLVGVCLLACSFLLNCTGGISNLVTISNETSVQRIVYCPEII